MALALLNLLCWAGLLTAATASRTSPLELPTQEPGLLEAPEGFKLVNGSELNATLNAAEYDYFERTYASSGWFTSPPILNTHVEASMVRDLIAKRARTHIPSLVSVYAVSYPRPLVYYNIMWAVNSGRIGWRMSYEEDGYTFQQSLNTNINDGYQVYQLESYAFDDRGTIYYSAIFFKKDYWPADTQFEISFGLPNDASYCCGPGSRWIRLRNAGYKPVSFSITEDPGNKGLYIADVWNTYNVGTWQGGMAKTAVQLQQTLASLANLSPVYLKAYRVSTGYGGHKILFTYLAKNMDSPALTLTTDVSNTAFATLAKLLKTPPRAFTSYYFDGEEDWEQAGYGGMYTALWEGVTTNM